MFSCLKGDCYRVSEIQLSYRSKINPSQRPKICSSEDSYAIFRRHWADDKLDFVEQSKLLLLNRANRVLGLYELSTGSTTGTIIDTRMVFAAALKTNASSIVVAHNHPSGNLEPSSRDKLLTNQLREAGALMNIPMLDHIIVGRHGYYSFADDEEFSLEQFPHMTTRGLSKVQNVVPMLYQKKKAAADFTRNCLILFVERSGENTNFFIEDLRLTEQYFSH